MRTFNSSAQLQPALRAYRDAGARIGFVIASQQEVEQLRPPVTFGLGRATGRFNVLGRSERAYRVGVGCP